MRILWGNFVVVLRYILSFVRRSLHYTICTAFTARIPCYQAPTLRGVLGRVLLPNQIIALLYNVTSLLLFSSYIIMLLLYLVFYENLAKVSDETIRTDAWALEPPHNWMSCSLYVVILGRSRRQASVFHWIVLQCLWCSYLTEVPGSTMTVLSWLMASCQLVMLCEMSACLVMAKCKPRSSKQMEWYA